MSSDSTAATTELPTPVLSAKGSEVPNRLGPNELVAPSGWSRLEEILDRIGDRLNPILVKEARQAMKSRQFVVTFSLLLIFGWLWTVLYVAFGVPGIFYAPVGPGVLTGYYVVLSIPLLIVVPYAAFRSLAAEREDGTYELLSITTLTAGQIVQGKLGSALLQMIVYYSALAPCIAFTYLMRGIDVVTIGLVLGYTFVASLLLSIFGLMMATVTRSRHWQILLSVVFVMALLVVTFFWDMGVIASILNAAELPYTEAVFWLSNLCVLSFTVPIGLLCYQIAAGQITFASENRSTPIRAILMMPQFLLIAWYVYFWIELDEGEAMWVLPCLLGIYWACAGSLLSGETAQLSPRAMRALPQSVLGRMAFTWFNPGSGTGYMFAMLNLLAGLLIALAAVNYGQILKEPAMLDPLGSWARRLFVTLTANIDPVQDVPEVWDWIPMAVCIFGYVAGYLGLGRILTLLARRATHVGMLATFLCHAILIAGGVLFPLLLQALISWGDFSTFEYTILQIPNWIWTLHETIDAPWTGLSPLAWIAVGSVGTFIMFVNLLITAREVEHVRLRAPRRVEEDEAELHPVIAKPRKSSPWD
jgi:hypothetical protein